MEVTKRAPGVRRSSMSQINVTPFVDVMLVLLIIFMVTAPMLDQGVEVDLPQVRQSPGLPSEQEPLVVVLHEIAGVARLESVIREAIQARPERLVFLQADEAVPYGLVVQIMAAVKQAGVDKLGMVTRLPEE